MFHTPQYHTACQMQKRILDAMGLEMNHAGRTPKPMKNCPKLRPGDIANLVKSWDLLENRKRILRGKGLPKPLEAPQKPKKALPATFTE